MENPFTASYLKSHLRKTTHRIILTAVIEKELKTDPAVKTMMRQKGRLISGSPMPWGPFSRMSDLELTGYI